MIPLFHRKSRDHLMSHCSFPFPWTVKIQYFISERPVQGGDRESTDPEAFFVAVLKNRIPQSWQPKGHPGSCSGNRSQEIPNRCWGGGTPCLQRGGGGVVELERGGAW